ncbi:MAG: glycosyltransferase family 2 protein [bacterium]
MSINKNKIYLIIPAYNEAKNIGEVLATALKIYSDIVVVDDGSSDETAAIVSLFNVHLLRHVTNRGQGAALRTGTKFAVFNGADIIVHFDADGQFLIDDIEVAIKKIVLDKVDLVFGSRFLNDNTKMPWFKKNIIMPLARLVNKLAFNINLTDPQSGFRVFTAKSFEKIIWQQDGMAHCTEILHRATRSGLTLAEVPITVIYHDFGQRLSGGFKILKDFFIYSLIN